MKKGGPNYAAAFGDGFYDDIVSGLQKMFFRGRDSVVSGGSGYTILFGSADGNVYAIM